jgi:hypothetical protein
MNPAMRTRSTVTERRRPAAGRRRPHRAARPAAVVAGPEQRVRAAGTPLDLAHYACACGCGFAAPATTSVSCPQCGSGQDW